MLTLVTICLILASCNAAPMDYWDQIQEYRSYLPDSITYVLNKTVEGVKEAAYDLYYDIKEDVLNVTGNLNNTLDDRKEDVYTLFEDIKEQGKDVVYDLYDDIREKALNRTSEQVDALTDLMKTFLDRVMAIHEDALEVLSQDGALTDEEIMKRNDKEGLEELRERFDDMEEELKKEAKENENLPEGLEQVVQNFITTIRGMMARMANKEAEFWSKLKQMEVNFWEMKSILADTTSELKERISSIFQTLQEVDINLIDDLGETDEDPKAKSSSLTQELWREDGRCGPKYPLESGAPGQCNPEGNAPRVGPCCSKKGFCGNTENHCGCPTCVDYSKINQK